ncbi:MAG: hypothetical protein AAF371_14520, partial [Pseudomonadota bacterium]
EFDVASGQLVTVAGDISDDFGVNFENVIGTTGDDTITGDDGANTIDGKEGIDVLFGGGGADVFVFAEGEGTDQIEDFEDGIDLFGLNGGLVFGDLTVAADGLDTVISVTSTGEELAVIVGTAPAAITEDDFTTVF